MLLDEIREVSLQRLLIRVGHTRVARLARLFSPLIRRCREKNVRNIGIVEFFVGTHSYTLANVSLLAYRHPIKPRIAPVACPGMRAIRPGIMVNKWLITLKIAQVKAIRQ